MQVDWIAVDWGTTHMRAYGMRGSDVVAQASSNHGMNSVAAGGFEPALLSVVEPWLASARTIPVICCGMVGARQGWAEAAYAQVPAAPTATRMTHVPGTDRRLSVHILPGLCQATPPDVMRGEETQIAGFLATYAGWDGVICLPGTHTKWAHVSAGEVVSFQTFMTGELFALLSENSVLRHSTGADGWDADAFTDAVADTLSNPETLAARLFRLRAADLLNGARPASARAALSGLLIGAELSAARPYWLGQNVAVIAAEPLAATYTAALQTQGVPATRADATAMTLAGLTAAHALLETAE